MKIKLHSANGFTEIGNRENNEDHLFPSVGKSSINDNLFLVCDGVGGHYGGEIASALVCEYISSYFNQNVGTPIDNKYIEQAIDFAREAIRIEQTKREIYGMATTLTLLHFGEKGAVVAHLGDSRIYQLRDGKIIWQSDDHSLVNSLVKIGEITKEEAKIHPKRNQITRSLNGDDNTPNDYAEIHTITDVQAQDYFFMCTDGVLEQINYDELLEFFIYNNSINSNSGRLESIREKCYGNTNDNFTAYLIQIESIEDSDVFASLILNPSKATELSSLKKSYLLPITTAILTLIIIIGGYFWQKHIQIPNFEAITVAPISQVVKTAPIEERHQETLPKIIDNKETSQIIPFGDNTSLKVIYQNKAQCFAEDKLIDEGVFYKGIGYVYYKSDKKPIYILYLEKPNKTFPLKESPIENKDGLKIRREKSDVYEKLNIKSGQIDGMIISVNK